MSDTPPTYLTPLGQSLWLEREISGVGNTQCPCCEDEESFGDLCARCFEDVEA